jgi:phosphate transport system substrate-binding protein
VSKEQDFKLHFLTKLQKDTSVTMFKHNITLIFSMIILFLMVVGCGPSSTQSEESSAEKSTPTSPEVTLTVSGSGSVTPILESMKSDFEHDTLGYRLEVLSGSGTGGGVQGIIEGVLDLAAMARAPKEEETAQAVEFVSLGQAGEALITEPNVGVSGLTSEQIVALFSGEVTNWSEVGGPDLPIILYVRDESDSSTKALREAILGDTPFPELVAQVLTSQSDMLAAVERTPGSIGIATWPTALAKKSKVKPIMIDGLTPSDPSYPMQTPLGIGYLVNRQADVQPLIDWLLSETGQALLQELDVILAP